MAFIYFARPHHLEFICLRADFGDMYREESDFSRWAPPSRPQTAKRVPDDNSPGRLLWEMGLVIGIPLLVAAVLSFVFPHIPY
jgi:hypothetical protein